MITGIPATNYRTFGFLNNTNDQVDVESSQCYVRKNVTRNARGRVGLTIRREDIEPYVYTKTGDAYDAPPQVGDVHSIFQFINNHNQDVFFYAIGDKLYKYLHPTHTQIIDSDYTDPYDFINVNSNFAIFCNGRDPLKYTDGITTDNVSGDFVPRPKFLTTFRGHVVAMNNEYTDEYLIDGANVFYMSEPGDGFKYDPTRNEIFDTPITGGWEQDGVLIITELDNITTFSGTTFETLNRNSLDMKIGCASHKSVIKSPFGTAWFGGHTFYRMQNLGNPIALDTTIQGLIDKIHPRCHPYIFGAYDPNKRALLWGVNIPEYSATNSYKQMNAILSFALGPQGEIIDIDVYPTECFLTSAHQLRYPSNRRGVVFGNYTGFVVRMNKGDTGVDFIDESTTANAPFEMEPGLDDLDTPDLVKDFVGMEIVCKDTTQDSIKVILSTDETPVQTYTVQLCRNELRYPQSKFFLTDPTDEQNFVLGTDVFNDQVEVRRYIPLNEVRGKWIRVKFETNSRYSIPSELIKYKFYLDSNETYENGTRGNY